jgi:hypothetical protein
MYHPGIYLERLRKIMKHSGQNNRCSCWTPYQCKSIPPSSLYPVTLLTAIKTSRLKGVTTGVIWIGDWIYWPLYVLYVIENSSVCTIYKFSVSTGFAEQIMPTLRILCYNGSLVTWTVVNLTTAKFKLLTFYRTAAQIAFKITPQQGPRRKHSPSIVVETCLPTATLHSNGRGTDHKKKHRSSIAVCVYIAGRYLGRAAVYRVTVEQLVCTPQ